MEGLQEGEGVFGGEYFLGSGHQHLREGAMSVVGIDDLVVDLLGDDGQITGLANGVPKQRLERHHDKNAFMVNLLQRGWVLEEETLAEAGGKVSNHVGNLEAVEDGPLHGLELKLAEDLLGGVALVLPVCHFGYGEAFVHAVGGCVLVSNVGFNLFETNHC